MMMPTEPPSSFYRPRKAKDCGASVDALSRPEEQLKRDLRALENVQASRPLKPPGRR